jgi:hypothetical protein
MSKTKMCCICAPERCWGRACFGWLCAECDSLTGAEWQAKQEEANRVFAETRRGR